MLLIRPQYTLLTSILTAHLDSRLEYARARPHVNLTCAVLAAAATKSCTAFLGVLVERVGAPAGGVAARAVRDAHVERSQDGDAGADYSHKDFG